METKLRTVWEAEGTLSEGFTAVKKDGKWGFIDREGKVVSECQWDEADDFSKEGLAKVEKDNNYGYIDKQGKVLIWSV